MGKFLNCIFCVFGADITFLKIQSVTPTASKGVKGKIYFV